MFCFLLVTADMQLYLHSPQEALLLLICVPFFIIPDKMCCYPNFWFLFSHYFVASVVILWKHILGLSIKFMQLVLFHFI